MSNIQPDSERWLEELPEPDALSAEEFDAWRGPIRLRETAMHEIDRRLHQQGELSLADYGILITLVTAPQLKLRMSDLDGSHSGSSTGSRSSTRRHCRESSARLPGDCRRRDP